MEWVNISFENKGHTFKQQDKQYDVKNGFHLSYCKEITFISVYLGKSISALVLEFHHAIHLYKTFISNLSH